MRTLLRYWPLPVAPGARDWIDDNIFAGNIGPLEVETNFAPGMLDQDDPARRLAEADLRDAAISKAIMSTA